MKKTLFTLAALLCCMLTAQAQLLYRISGNGLTDASYILGTCHTADISFVDSIPGLRRAMDDAQQVYGETLKDAQSEPTDEDMDKYMLLPQGVLIDSLLSADEMKRLTAFMTDSCKIDSANVGIFFDVKPFPLALYLALRCDGFKETLKSNDGVTFDEYFQKEALRQGKEIGGLESKNSQFKLFCNSFSLKRQKELLMCMVDNHKRPGAEGSGVETYYSQNLDAIWKELNDNTDVDCGYTSEEQMRLLSTRNLAWMKNIPSLMSRKSTLFVVGALHLPGPNGVLDLLSKAGYTVEAVTK